MIEIPDLHGLILNANGDYHTKQWLELRSGRVVFNLSELIDYNSGDFGLRKGYYDFIVSIDVIGKLYNPAHYLSELYYGCQYEGKLIFTTPCSVVIDTSEYFHYFNEKRLKRLFGDMGWHITRLEKRKLDRKGITDHPVKKIINTLFGKYWYGEAGKV